jgi:CRP/FNR family transcriptional regulator/CRP/FNR family cyclic AMP-dependent transcriptional regulator
MIDINIVKNLPIFYDLDSTEIEEVAKICDSKVFHPGEVIMREGEPGGTLFVIKKGDIKITRKIHDQEDMVLTILRQNDFFGELSLMDGRARSATATAMTQAELVLIKKEEFDAFVNQNPVCGYKFMKRIALVIGSLLRDMNEKFVGMLDYMWR